MLKDLKNFKISTTFIGLFLFLFYIILYFYINSLTLNSSKKSLVKETEIISQKVLNSLIKTQTQTQQLAHDFAQSAYHFNLTQENTNKKTRNKTALLNFMKETLRINSGHLFALTFAFNPAREQYSPYVFFQNGKVSSLNLADSNYDYPQRSWYRISANSKKDHWGLPYLDEGASGELITTYSYPLVKNNNLLAVVAIDLPLSRAQTILKNLDTTHHELFLIAKSKDNKQVHYLAQTLKDSSLYDKFLKEVKENEFTILTINKTRKFVSTKKVGDTSWILGVSFDEKTLMGQSFRVQIQILLLFILSFFFLVAVIYFSSKGIIRRSFKRAN